jgi:hypothetical protein
LVITGGDMPTFININPFEILVANTWVTSIALQGFLIAMAVLTVGGVLLDIKHKKNVKYFFDNAKKSKRKSDNKCPNR